MKCMIYRHKKAHTLEDSETTTQLVLRYGRLNNMGILRELSIIFHIICANFHTISLKD